MSKITETAVATPLELRHSAYRTGYITEKARFRMKNYILVSTNQRTAVSVVPLDLSAGFDTVDNGVLLTLDWKYVWLIR